ncbi:MAG: phage holin [Alphaproteobacteria bacterium]|nr:phage holin [Alphaproteobacteria bacterium]
MNNNKISILVRTCVLFVALINQLLMVFGYSILPISEQQISELCTALFTIAAALWNWWTNNRLNN